MEGMGSSFQGGLKAIAQTSRLKIIRLLVEYGELCVNDIMKRLNLSQVKVSQHLRVMKYQELVTCRRNGHRQFYSINRERIDELIEVLRKLLVTSDQ